MKLYELINKKSFLESLSKNETLGGKNSLVLYRLINQLDPEIQRFDKVRIDLLKKYSKKDENSKMCTSEDGEAVFENDNDKQAFEKELYDVVDVDIDSVFDKVTIELTDKITITAHEIKKLSCFIDFTEKE